MVATRANRSTGLGLLWTLLAAVAAGTTIWVALVLSSNAHSFSDRLAEAGVIIAGATLVLALIAAVVAVMAFAAATGQPDLKLRVSFPFSAVNRPTFKAHSGKEGGWLSADDLKQTTGTILLSNESRYSAKNPAVTVRLENLYVASSPEEPSLNGWIVIGFANTLGITAVQWDGGPNYSVHGKSIRQLPPLDLRPLRQPVDRGPAGLSFELLADGYRREVLIPVELRLAPEQDQPPEQQVTEPEHLPPHWL
jgi:hypothetical protein